MFTLAYGFYKHWTQKEEYCVLILGLDNAGKTVRYFFFPNLVAFSLRKIYSKFDVFSFVTDVFGSRESEIRRKLQENES